MSGDPHRLEHPPNSTFTTLSLSDASCTETQDGPRLPQSEEPDRTQGHVALQIQNRVLEEEMRRRQNLERQNRELQSQLRELQTQVNDLQRHVKGKQDDSSVVVPPRSRSRMKLAASPESPGCHDENSMHWPDVYEHLMKTTKFLPDFCNEVDPLLLLPRLNLEPKHREEIMNTCNNKSKHQACQELLGHVWRRRDWPRELQDALKDSEYDALYKVLKEALRHAPSSSSGCGRKMKEPGGAPDQKALLNGMSRLEEKVLVPHSSPEREPRQNESVELLKGGASGYTLQTADEFLLPKLLRKLKGKLLQNDVEEMAEILSRSINRMVRPKDLSGLFEIMEETEKLLPYDVIYLQTLLWEIEKKDIFQLVADHVKHLNKFCPKKIAHLDAPCLEKIDVYEYMMFHMCVHEESLTEQMENLRDRLIQVLLVPKKFVKYVNLVSAEYVQSILIVLAMPTFICHHLMDNFYHPDVQEVLASLHVDYVLFYHNCNKSEMSSTEAETSLTAEMSSTEVDSSLSPELSSTEVETSVSTEMPSTEAENSSLSTEMPSCTEIESSLTGQRSQEETSCAEISSRTMDRSKPPSSNQSRDAAASSVEVGTSGQDPAARRKDPSSVTEARHTIQEYSLTPTCSERKTTVSRRELFPRTAGLDEEVVESSERDTAAVIRYRGQMLEISGRNADSALENLAQSVLTLGESKISTQRGGGGKEEGGRGRLGGQPLAAPSVDRMPARNSAATSSAQVNPAARVGATSASPGMSSGLGKEESDDSGTSLATGIPSVPRSTLRSLSEPLPFHLTPQRVGSDPSWNYSGGVSLQMPAFPLFGKMGVSRSHEHSRHVEKVAERLTSTTIHMRPESLACGPQEKGASEDKGKDYFRNLGTSVGYTGKEVEEALLYVNLHPQKYQMSPTEFLKMLRTIKVVKPKIMNPQPEAVVISSDDEASPGKLRGRERERMSYSKVSPQSEQPASRSDTPSTMALGLTARDVAEIDKRQWEMRKKFLAQFKEKDQQTAVQTKVMKQYQGGGELPLKLDVVAKRTRAFSIPGALQTTPIPGRRPKLKFCDTEYKESVLKLFDALSEGEGGCHSGDSPLQTPSSKASQLRFIVIDANNVAFAHGKKKDFSSQGLYIAIDYFRKLGHEVTAILPEYRKCKLAYGVDMKPVISPDFLQKLLREDVFHFTPSHQKGRRYMVELAQKKDGVIVSNDQYRDLVKEHPDWQDFIEDRLLPFNFVKDHFMLPQDPLGPEGPPLEEFLRKPPSTFKKLQIAGAGATDLKTSKVESPSGDFSPRLPASPRQGRPQPLVHDPPHHPDPLAQPQAAVRSRSRSSAMTEELVQGLKKIFPRPEQIKRIREVLADNPDETDLNCLSNKLLH